MGPNDPLRLLRDLEVALHQPEVRRDRAQLDALLHESFIEFGRSGRSYRKDDILELLLQEETSCAIWSQEFAVDEIADGVALLTYRSASIDERGQLSGYALRASLWQRTERGWQVRFHQGTPTGAFAKNNA